MWRAKAACADAPIDLFFPSEWAPNSYYDEGKKFCWRCPVRFECLGDALANDISSGLWGGLTPTERRRVAVA